MKRKGNKKIEKGPVYNALCSNSYLLIWVKPGLGSLKNEDKQFIGDSLRSEFTDSLDLDAAIRLGHEQENRWDYLLGHQPSTKVIALEPHSAKSDEVSTVIAKKKAALVQLRGHLKPGKFIAKWLWVASGKVHFHPMESAIIRLNNSGIEFVERKVMPKHVENL